MVSRSITISYLDFYVPSVTIFQMSTVCSLPNDSIWFAILWRWLTEYLEMWRAGLVANFLGGSLKLSDKYMFNYDLSKTFIEFLERIGGAS